MDDLISWVAAVRALASSDGDYFDILKRLEKIPAVDAIPVEWLEKQADIARLEWDYDTCEAIHIVLKAWQNEQEAR